MSPQARKCSSPIMIAIARCESGACVSSPEARGFRANAPPGPSAKAPRRVVAMTTRSGWHLLPNGFSLVAAVFLLVNYFSPFGDLDFAWQIRTGERIVATGSLRPPDAFTYTIAGTAVPDFEWLYEV